MVVLVIGKGGQVASCLEHTAHKNKFPHQSINRAGLDLTELSSVSSAIKTIRPSVVINTAGFTDVEAAESCEPSILEVNSIGVGHLAKVCSQYSIPIIHLSTDYVFNGRNHRNYTETDETFPINNYGASKLTGEQLLIANTPQHIILRTAWVYSPFGKNFAKTILSKATTESELSVIDDQVGSPTYGIDLANAIWEIAEKTTNEHAKFNRWGIYHIANQGQVSWFQLAQQILKNSKNLGGPVATVKPVSSSEIASKVKRPSFSSLDCSKIKNTLNISLPSWQKSVSICVAEILNSTKTS